MRPRILQVAAAAATIALIASFLALPVAAAGRGESSRAPERRASASSVTPTTQGGSRAAPGAARPARTISPADVPGATLPTSSCGAPIAGLVTCDLYATPGSVVVPGPSGPVTVPIWGYSTTSTPGSATLPGPTLIVGQSDNVDIVLHNVDLPAAAGNTSLAIPGQAGASDLSGIGTGSSKTYSFRSTNPLAAGTYLYEAGKTEFGATQVAMGLYGALIVRPTGALCATPPTDCSAYGSAFQDEALVLVSEIDPAFNANPAGFDMHGYAPKYWLINGKAYPDTDPTVTPFLQVAASDAVLLRYLNAGLEDHSIGLLGLRQRVLATDGKGLVHPYAVVAETIPAGTTLDTLTTIPAAAPAGSRYALYNAALHLDNSGARDSASNTAQVRLGGMLAFLTVAGSGGAAGAASNNVTLTPATTNGSVPVSLTATIGAAGDPAIIGAEYFVDSVGASATGCAITTGLGPAPATVSATILTTGASAPCVDLATLTSSLHTFYVHGLNSNGWGGFGSAALNLDKLGPTSSALTLSSTPTNGSVDVALGVSGSDVARGDSNVDAAEYFIGPAFTCPSSGGGTGVAMTKNSPAGPATQAHYVATIPAATVAAVEGARVIGIHSHDALGNWGPCATITLNVDKTAPNASGVASLPNPTNGTIGLLIGQNVLQHKLAANASDPVGGGINSNIKAVEAFVDTVGANGTGTVLIPTDGAYSSPSEAAFAALPLWAIQALSQGRHTVWIRAQDAAGNWGPLASGTMDVDKTGPTVTAASATPNPTGGAGSVILNASATDPVTGGTPAAAPACAIMAAEWFDGADPGLGLGTAMSGTFGGTIVSNLSASFSLAGLSLGTHNISIRALDVAGNWGPTRVVLLNVTPADLIFADGFEGIGFPPTPWSSQIGPAVSATGAGAMVGSRAMQVVISSTASRYVQDNSPATTDARYRARFYFNPNGATTASNQQHDIFVGLNNANATVFRVQYRRNSNSGNAAQVRIVVSRSGGSGVTTGSWFTINTNAANFIEVNFVAASSATVTLFTNGTARNLTGLNSSSATNYRIQTVRLGPQVGPNSVAGSLPAGTTLAGVSAAEYFDAFVSRRNNTLIGP